MIADYQGRPLANALAMRRAPFKFLTGLAREHGDWVRLRLGKAPAVLVNDPETIRQVLVVHDESFSKSRGLRVAERLLGKGLLTSEGELHAKQRKLVQPAFHRPRLSHYADVMTTRVEQMQSRWTPGGTIDLAHEMRRLTLLIAGESLFGADVESETEQIGRALDDCLRLFNLAMLPYADRLEPYFKPITRRFENARDRLNDTVYRIISERRGDPRDRHDVLTILLNSGMSDEQVRDEAITMLLAAHETTATALTYSFWLLAQHPEVASKALDEVGDRPATTEDLPRLSYLRMAVSEAIRLYPPAWLISRTAVEPCTVGELSLVKGESVLVSPWVLHRDARRFDNPLEFRPDRWTPEAISARHRFAYVPFGAGSRICIGEHFAWMESQLVLANVLWRWRLEPLPGSEAKPRPGLTLRPGGKILMRSERR